MHYGVNPAPLTCALSSHSKTGDEPKDRVHTGTSHEEKALLRHWPKAIGTGNFQAAIRLKAERRGPHQPHNGMYSKQLRPDTGAHTWNPGTWGGQGERIV